jgi:hypothetical protein
MTSGSRTVNTWKGCYKILERFFGGHFWVLFTKSFYIGIENMKRWVIKLIIVA